MRRALLGVVGVCALGCAHHPAPSDQLEKSIATVRGAEEAGASAVPEAALHLRLAQEQIAQAKDLLASEETRRAEDKALRAAQDAELALALAHEQSSNAKLHKLAESDSAGGEATTSPAQGAPQ